MICNVSNDSLAQSTPLWHVLQTLPRQEKALSRDLHALAIHHFLPLREKTQFYGKRKIKSELPLFPGYLFVQGSLEQAYQADRTGRVARIIPVADQPQIERELAQIKAALSAGANLEPYNKLSIGTAVQVRGGPLIGMTGEVEDIPRPNRLILRIKTLGQAVSLEIDSDLLEPLELAAAA